MNIAAKCPALWKQKGFTLLELVLVLFLIGLLASAGLLFTDNLRDDAQFDETQRRLEMIRKAIIQSGERTVNNQPELSGFVVDNGRLPYCLEELLFVDTTVAVSGTNEVESPCNDTGELTIKQPGVTSDGIRYGWWGPYIQVQPDQDGGRRFRDGYENAFVNVSVVAPAAIEENSGWLWTLKASDMTPLSSPVQAIDPMAYTLSVSSVGFDLNSSMDDYPPTGSETLITSDAWLAQDTYTVRFFNVDQTTAVSGIPLSDPAYKWTLTLANSASNFSTDAITIAASSIPAAGSGNNAVDETATFSSRIPAGHYRVSLTCENSPGDCVTENVSTPYRVIVFPRQQLAPIRWNVKPR
ncbi:prepilin-type N-terminal cleavage/methylation domain-containing protein [uncultured Methylophaga sp.]|uniref:prepilin-type N-terminal cleavage/methylation domain-containing protein n=1 Tax=uncultured Methylophaga sp. TaxID=285271 RepID=UPI002605FD43|nr:prepilin-type N-terminal cleavage/methylation domain-containing protein [uncultured Methylophaga sp.]